MLDLAVTWQSQPNLLPSCQFSVYIATKVRIEACRWLTESVWKPWNIIVAAPNDMDQVTCPHCLFLHRFDPGLQQGRYALLYQLMQSAQWHELVAGKHRYLYFPEEAIVQDISAIST